MYFENISCMEVLGETANKKEDSSNRLCMNLLILVMRNQGSLRLILNTRLWGQMVLKRANSKSLCFTATDQEDHSVQVFLIQVIKRENPTQIPTSSRFLKTCWGYGFSK